MQVYEKDHVNAQIFLYKLYQSSFKNTKMARISATTGFLFFNSRLLKLNGVLESI